MDKLPLDYLALSIYKSTLASYSDSHLALAAIKNAGYIIVELKKRGIVAENNDTAIIQKNIMRMISHRINQENCILNMTKEDEEGLL